MTHTQPETGQLWAYVCRYCGRPDPGEWGTGRRCPEHPGKDKFPAYMQGCEFCPVPAVERDKAVAIVRELREAFAPVRDPAQDEAMAHSHNWLMDTRG